MNLGNVDDDLHFFGVIKIWINQNTKNDQLALFLFHHFCIYPIHGLTTSWIPTIIICAQEIYL